MSRMLYKDRKSSQGWPKHEQGRGEGGLSNCSWEERGLLYTLWWAPVPPPHPVPSPSHTGDSLRRGPEWQAAPPFRPLSWAQGQPAGQGGSQRSVEALAPRTPGPGHWGPCLPLWLAWWGGPRQTALTNYTLKKDILFPLYQSKTQKERIVLNCTEGTLHCVREVKCKHTNSRATNATAACFSFSSRLQPWE